MGNTICDTPLPAHIAQLFPPIGENGNEFLFEAHFETEIARFIAPYLQSTFPSTDVTISHHHYWGTCIRIRSWIDIRTELSHAIHQASLIYQNFQ